MANFQVDGGDPPRNASTPPGQSIDPKFEIRHFPSAWPAGSMRGQGPHRIFGDTNWPSGVERKPAGPFGGGARIADLFVAPPRRYSPLYCARRRASISTILTLPGSPENGETRTKNIFFSGPAGRRCARSATDSSERRSAYPRPYRRRRPRARAEQARRLRGRAGSGRGSGR